MKGKKIIFGLVFAVLAVSSCKHAMRAEEYAKFAKTRDEMATERAEWMKAEAWKELWREHLSSSSDNTVKKADIDEVVSEYNESVNRSTGKFAVKEAYCTFTYTGTDVDVTQDKEVLTSYDYEKERAVEDKWSHYFDITLHNEDKLH